MWWGLAREKGGARMVEGVRRRALRFLAPSSASLFPSLTRSLFVLLHGVSPPPSRFARSLACSHSPHSRWRAQGRANTLWSAACGFCIAAAPSAGGTISHDSRTIDQRQSRPLSLTVSPSFNSSIRPSVPPSLHPSISPSVIHSISPVLSSPVLSLAFCCDCGGGRGRGARTS